MWSFQTHQDRRAHAQAYTKRHTRHTICESGSTSAWVSARAYRFVARWLSLAIPSFPMSRARRLITPGQHSSSHARQTDYSDGQRRSVKHQKWNQASDAFISIANVTSSDDNSSGSSSRTARGSFVSASSFLCVNTSAPNLTMSLGSRNFLNFCYISARVRSVSLHSFTSSSTKLTLPSLTIAFEYDFTQQPST